MNRRAFLRTVAGSSGWLAAGSVLSADQPATNPVSNELLPGSKEGIETHRKGGGVVVVRDPDGKPVADATVKIEQIRHDFLFGCNLFGFEHLRGASLEGDYRARFAALFNYATLPFYWATYEPQRGQPGYGYSTRAAAWCREQAITVKGHPLVWDHPAGCPRWLPTDLDEVGRLSHERVSSVVGYFKGQINLWDVVNEAVHLGQANQEQPLSKWAVKLGARRYVAEHLKLARAANPQATLLVNDYRLEPAYYALLDSLRDNGALLFDAVGLQSHMHAGGWPMRQLWNHCETFGRLGLPLHFTETTVVSGPRLGPGERWGATTPALEATQADYVTRFYTQVFAHPAVQAITWWDFSDNGAWQGAAAGFLRKDMTPKPVYERLLALIKGEWWTRTTGRTNEKGEFATRAFYGTQRLTASRPAGRTASKEVAWVRSGGNRFEITL
jgi:endo-1,4-beta-xylanase